MVLKNLRVSREQLIIGCLTIGFVFVALWSIGAVMRETDQSSLVDGAWRLRHGIEAEPGIYQFDKQFVSYTLAAFVVPNWPPPLDETAIGSVIRRINLLSAAVFLSGAVFLSLCLSAGRTRARGAAIPWLVFLTAPIILLSIPVASAAMISGGFVLFLAGLLCFRNPPSVPLCFATGLLAFLATGARADAILCFPILCWATVRPGTWRALITAPHHWAMAVGSLLALLTGRILAGERDVLVYDAFFEWKVFAAYLVFGLGGLLIVAAGVIAALAQNGLRRYGYTLAGIAFLLVPFTYYGWQLFSPRHLITFGLGVLIAAVGIRGRALWRWWIHRNPRLISTGATVAAGLALLPLGIALHLPAPGSPSVSVGDATRYPTTDGLWPMGGYGRFFVQLKNADTDSLDHNQATWMAAISDQTQWPEGEKITILETPLRNYLALALRFRGRVPRYTGIGDGDPGLWGRMGSAVSDERSLRTQRPGHIRRSGNDSYRQWREEFESASVVSISPEISSLTIVRLDRNSREPGDDRSIVERRKIASLIGSNDFTEAETLLPAEDTMSLPSDLLGKSLVLASEGPFSVDGDPAEYHQITGAFFYAAVLNGTKAFPKSGISIRSDAPIRVWASVLPDYMSRERMIKDRDNVSNRSSAPPLPPGSAERSSNTGATTAQVP